MKTWFFLGLMSMAVTGWAQDSQNWAEGFARKSAANIQRDNEIHKLEDRLNQLRKEQEPARGVSVEDLDRLIVGQLGNCTIRKLTNYEGGGFYEIKAGKRVIQQTLHQNHLTMLAYSNHYEHRNEVVIKDTGDHMELTYLPDARTMQEAVFQGYSPENKPTSVYCLVPETSPWREYYEKQVQESGAAR
jgi:hypothetical protein